MQRIRTTTALLALVAVAAAAAPAAAGTRLVIRGAGWGHGVGMSQYGAYGFAEHGKDHRFILGHYYTGTTLGRLASNPRVRVLLQTVGTASFTNARSASGRRLDPARTYQAAATGVGRVALRSASGRTLQTFTAPLRVRGRGPLRLHGSAENGVTSGTYRGRMEFHPTSVGTIQSVNVVGLEAYLRGVVPAESPASWPEEALKAQAVAARTYSITTGGGTTFDQYADTRSQMYRGVIGEYATTDAAIRATRGEIVTYRGEPVVTYFFSTSGGRTENVENSFIGADPKPWLKSVSDPHDDLSPKHRWSVRMSMGEAAAKLGGLVKGTFRGIDVVRRGESPRVVYADVVGSRGRTRVTGPTLRARLGLNDTWATFSTVGTSAAAASVRTVPAREGGAARAASIAQRGSVSGRVGWTERRTRVVLRQQTGRRWKKVATATTDRRGRYVFDAVAPGRYRVAWRGAVGPVVRV